MTTQQVFTVKFNNGYWKVFDSVLYKDVKLELLYKDAKNTADVMNRKYGSHSHAGVQ